MSIRQDVIDRFARELYPGKPYAEEWATVCERAGYRCEYCGKDMLVSVDDYRSMQNDHIIPQRANGKDHIDNYALSCSVCNGPRFKGQYNPAEDVGEDVERAEKIQAVRRHLIKKRVENYKHFLRCREIVGYPFSHQQGCSCG